MNVVKYLALLEAPYIYIPRLSVNDGDFSVVGSTASGRVVLEGASWRNI
jgi:hypothetical protein